MGAKRRRPRPTETPTIALSSDRLLQMKERLALTRVRRTAARIALYGPEEAEAMRREDLQRREWQAKGQQHENQQWAMGRAMGQANKGRFKQHRDKIVATFLAQRGRVESRTEACRRAARKLNVSAETVRRHTKHLPWR